MVSNQKERSAAILNQTQQKHYELWVALGDERSLRKLSERTGTSLTTLKKWSSRFKWNDLLRDRQAPIIRQIAEEADGTLEKSIKQARTIVRILIEDYLEKVERKEIVLKTTADLERLYRSLSLLVEQEKQEENRVKVRDNWSKLTDSIRASIESMGGLVPDLSEKPREE
jgi:protein-arginine kinase